MVFAYIMTGLLGFLGGQFARERKWALLGLALLGILIFPFQDHDLLTITCVAVPALAAGVFAKRVEWTIIVFTLASALIAYYTETVLTALIFAGGSGVLVWKLAKNKKKGAAGVVAVIAIVITIVLLP
ncbi:hypothetical protein [Actinomadura mexicana]|uniref:Uncharacterized protein n=1 Tax=Actinomadura mexicana TaxID=134959 RepID=A0A239D5F4_9ACTN|nr:hypothetical protein [Actinomadura mexicana]SNS26823.1 hypothetical protein SAMN06265355_113261 [Actinomadura mexicana]